MSILSRLEKFERSELDDWYNLEEQNREEFLLELVLFSEKEPIEIEEFCRTKLPKEFSVLEIIYEALSTKSEKFNQFLFQEIKRNVSLALDNKLSSSDLEIIQDIDLELIAETDAVLYLEIIYFLIESLSSNHSEKLNMIIIDTIDFYLIELDDDFPEFEKIKTKLYDFGQLSTSRIKNQINQIFEANEEQKNGLTNAKWTFFFFTGLILSIVALEFYDFTFISKELSLALYFGSSAIGLLIINYSKAKKTFVLFKIMYAIACFGGTFMALILCTNFYLRSSNTYQIKSNIVKTSFVGSKRKSIKPTAYFNHKGLQKEVVFKDVSMEAVKKSKVIECTISKGCLGFEVILSKSLKQ